MSNNPFAYQSTEPATVEPRSGFKKALDVAQFVVLGLALLVLMYLFFIIPTQVDGNSMFPNLKNDEILLTNRLVQQFGGPGKPLGHSYDYQRGDIVVFRKESIPKDIVKRVVGMPGDRVRISAGRVYINDQLFVEEYIDVIFAPTEQDTFLAENAEVTVPEDSYFLMGDNRKGSTDSRSQEIGFVKRSEIKGSPFLRVYPFSDFSYLSRGKSQLQ